MKNYLSLIKFSHTIFALPFALIGFSLAIAKPENTFVWTDLFFVLICMIMARSAAMAFNRYLDAEIDYKNTRTANREIPSGIITKNNALYFVIICGILFITSAALLNTLCFYLSPVALLIILGYSFTKRFTWLCHFILGLGLALAPIGAYLAVSKTFDLLPILFSMVVITWVSGFDIIYALQDEEFDKLNSLFSIPAYLGKKKALLFSSIIHGLSCLFVIIAGQYGNFGKLYWIGAGFFTALIIYQHLLVKPNDLSKVNMAFFTMNGFASIIFCSFVLSDLFIF